MPSAVMPEEVPIPEPWGLPFLGHIAEFNPENPLEDIHRLADTFGRETISMASDGPIAHCLR